MIEITFTSETLQELAEQAAQFANTVNGEAKSAKTSRTNKGKQAPPAETPPTAIRAGSIFTAAALPMIHAVAAALSSTAAGNTCSGAIR